MNIIKNSIKDITDDFSKLLDSLEGCNYVVTYEIVKFIYSKDNHFNLENLQELYEHEHNEPNTEGDLKISDFNYAKKTITECLAYTASGGGFDIEKDKNIIEERLKTFWVLVMKHFQLPPTKIYMYEPYYESYFGGGLFWGFCFIFLNDINEGIVLSIGAWD